MIPEIEFTEIVGPSSMDHDGELAGLVEEITQKLEAGDPIDLADYAQAPDDLKRLRKVLPALEVLVLAGQANHQARGANAASDHDELLSGHQLGDFKIVRELGRGGMGVVYEAEQLSIGRRVALKVLPFAALVQDKSVQRFHNEVRAAAALDHPNIVSIYSVGEERGVHYYAMQLVRGQTLAELVDQLRNEQGERCLTSDAGSIETNGVHRLVSSDQQPDFSIDTRPSTAFSTASPLRSSKYHRSIARIGIQAAEALQHAHDQGVLHRDIKPSNLLLDREGKLYVTDFGLARIGTDAGMTMTGDLVGTLRYMAPEQALGKRMVVDHRADVYSLGATLYELLTLRPAFDEIDRADLLKKIAFEEPQSLRKDDHCIPAELEIIVLKAMAKERDERYQTAQQLTDDLRAFLEHRPIKAKPASFANRAAKWSRRHQSLVWTIALGFIALSAILAISIARVQRAQSQAVSALEGTSDLLYTTHMTLAYQSLEKGLHGEVQAILDRYRPESAGHDRRGLEWQLLQALVRPPRAFTLAGHQGAVNEIAVFPDQNRLASVGDDGTLRIWDVRTHRLLRTITVGAKPLYSVAISSNGKFVAVGSRTLHLCDLTHEAVSELFQSNDNIESIAFGTDGQQLVIGTRYHEVCLLSLDGRVVKRIPCASRVQSLEHMPGHPTLLVPNRRPVVTGKPVEIVELWRDDLSAVEQVFDASQGENDGRITVARPSPCGKWIAAGESYKSRACILDPTTGEVVDATPVSRDRLMDLAYSPDGKSLAIGYRNGNVQYFSLYAGAGHDLSIDGRPLVVNAHHGEITCVRFVAANLLATSGVDGVIKLWDLSMNAARAFDITDTTLSGVKLSPLGDLLLCTTAKEIIIFNTDRGEIMSRGGQSGAKYSDPSWSPTGDLAAVCDYNAGSVAILAPNGRTITSIFHGADLSSAVFSPDGSLIAIIGAEHLQLCDAADGRQIFGKSLEAEGQSVVFSHDGKRLAYAGSNGVTTVLRLADLNPCLELAYGSDAKCLAFSPNDSIIASGHADSIICIWDAHTGQLRTQLAGHEGYPTTLAFSSDGKTLLSSALDSSLRIWSIDHGRSYGVVYSRYLPGTRHDRCMLSLTSDNRYLAVGFRTPLKDRPDVLLWNLRSGQN
jgi:serine/threonine protein kinase/WD40 repeat protein